MSEITCVILAGGLSERFGGDKLLAKYRGEEIIGRVCRAARPCVDELIISTRSMQRAEQLSEILDNLVDGYVVDDEKLSCPGPLRGIATAASKTTSNYLLTLSADLPELTPEALNKLINNFTTNQAEPDAGSIVWGNGAVETLIQIHKTQKLRENLTEICGVRKDMARPSDLLRASHKLLLLHGKNLADSPLVFANVNRPEDLVSLKPRAPLGGYVEGDVMLEERHSEAFWKALQSLKTPETSKEAVEHYLAEASEYLRHGINHLAGHALLDASILSEELGMAEEARKHRKKARETLARMNYEYG